MAIADPIEVAKHFCTPNYVLVANVQSGAAILTLPTPLERAVGCEAVKDPLSLGAYFSEAGLSAERSRADADDEPDVEMLETFSPIRF